jgi:hypothetical protein
MGWSGGRCILRRSAWCHTVRTEVLNAESKVLAACMLARQPAPAFRQVGYRHLIRVFGDEMIAVVKSSPARESCVVWNAERCSLAYTVTGTPPTVRGEQWMRIGFSSAFAESAQFW